MRELLLPGECHRYGEEINFKMHMKIHGGPSIIVDSLVCCSAQERVWRAIKDTHPSTCNARLTFGGGILQYSSGLPSFVSLEVLRWSRFPDLCESHHYIWTEYGGPIRYVSFSRLVDRGASTDLIKGDQLERATRCYGLLLLATPRWRSICLSRYDS
jgi:hypothetical protein